MIVMPYMIFKRQGYIPKSTNAFREEAFRNKTLVKFDEKSHKAIFISHRWWYFPTGPQKLSGGYNTLEEQLELQKGAPDYPEGEKKNRKWQVIIRGMRNLVVKESLVEPKIVLWMDYFSIYQDDLEMKLKGVESLIKYATLCDYMLVPTEEDKMLPPQPEKIPEYGRRGWCRCEYFIFSSWCEMQNKGDVQLYAASLDGTLRQYKKVVVRGEDGVLPSQGDFVVENDRSLVEGLEERMVSAYGSTVLVNACKAKSKSASLHKNARMIRALHIPALGEALTQYRVTALDLSQNQLGDDVAVALADVLRSNGILTELRLKNNEIGNEGATALAEGAQGNTMLITLDLRHNKIGSEAIAQLRAVARHRDPILKVYVDPQSS